jgi:hypothetical protein
MSGLGQNAFAKCSYGSNDQCYGETDDTCIQPNPGDCWNDVCSTSSNDVDHCNELKHETGNGTYHWDDDCSPKDDPDWCKPEFEGGEYVRDNDVCQSGDWDQWDVDRCAQGLKEPGDECIGPEAYMGFTDECWYPEPNSKGVPVDDQCTPETVVNDLDYCQNEDPAKDDECKCFKGDPDQCYDPTKSGQDECWSIYQDPDVCWPEKIPSGDECLPPGHGHGGNVDECAAPYKKVGDDGDSCLLWIVAPVDDDKCDPNYPDLEKGGDECLPHWTDPPGVDKDECKLIKEAEIGDYCFPFVNGKAADPDQCYTAVAPDLREVGDECQPDKFGDVDVCVYPFDKYYGGDDCNTGQGDDDLCFLGEGEPDNPVKK